MIYDFFVEFAKMLGEEVLAMLEIQPTIDWLKRHGRPLDVARYMYLFEDGKKEGVLAVLIAYQNEDGGFGHGLEPDCQNPDSSPLQTMTAMEIVDELNLSRTHPVVKNMLAYLIDEAPRDKNGMYHATIPSNNDHPHAPWWTHDKKRPVRGYVPTAAIAGFVYARTLKDDRVHREMKELIQRIIRDFQEKPTDEMHDLKSLLDMVDFIPSFDAFSDADHFLRLLLEQIKSTIGPKPKQWFTSYAATPLSYYPTTEHYGFRQFEELVEKHAGLLLKHRNDEGVWDITWSWDEKTDAFLLAKEQWKSIIALSHLKSLKAFGIIRKE